MAFLFCWIGLGSDLCTCSISVVRDVHMAVDFWISSPLVHIYPGACVASGLCRQARGWPKSALLS